MFQVDIMLPCRHFLLITWLLTTQFHWLLASGCFTSQNTQLTCECISDTDNSQAKAGVCSLVGTHATFPEFTHTDTTYSELVVRAGAEGAEVSHVDTQTFYNLALSTLRLEKVKLGGLKPRAFLSVSGTLYNLHLADNHLESVNVSVDAFENLAQMTLLNISGNFLDPVGKWFETNTNLNQLYLANNEIAQIEDGVFHKLNHLEKLDLSGNLLQQLSSGVLDGPSNLQTLAVSSNKISSLSKDIFANINSLKTLDLSHNAIGNPPEDSLSQLVDLNTLHMRGNGISVLPEGLLQQNRYLKTVSFDMNDLETLPVDLFKPTDALQVVSVSHNRISDLPSSLFREYSSLQEIDISNNVLTTLQDGLFSHLSRVKRLYLQDNRLTRISKDDFADMSDLLTLNLTNNRIFFSDLSGAFLPFRNLGSLMFLYLQDNRITDLPDNVFSGLEQLAELNVSSNGLETIAPRAFVSLVELTKLDLSNNSLTGLPSDLDKTDLSRLKQLYMSRNMLRGYNSSMFGGFGALQRLNLDHCVITDFKEGMLDLTHLQILDLSHNAAMRLVGSPFQNLRGMRKLYMRSSGMTSLPNMSLSGEFPSLLEIDLSSNSISSLPMGVFTNLTSSPLVNLTYNSLTSLEGGLGGSTGVTTLDLRWNAIRCMSPTVEGDTPHTAYYLSSNPLQCGCYMAWATALATCTTDQGQCVRDNATCTGTGMNALAVQVDPCEPWKCPDPPSNPPPEVKTGGARGNTQYMGLSGVMGVALLSRYYLLLI